MQIGKCKRIELPVAADDSGALAFAEGGRHVPFPIARTYFVYDLEQDAVRGVHAHRDLEQVVFCVSGRLELELDDGFERRTVVLEDPRSGLLLPPLVWHRLSGFAPGTVYLVLSSGAFDESDYIRDYDEFLATVGVAAAS